MQIYTIVVLIVILIQAVWYFLEMTSFAQILNQDLEHERLMTAVNSRN